MQVGAGAQWRPGPAGAEGSMSPRAALLAGALGLALAAGCSRPGWLRPPDLDLPDLRMPSVDLSQPGFRSHYCAASTGAVDFQQERCGPIADAASGYYDSLSWCRTAPTISTQRTATSQIGHKVNLIRAVVASCNGTSNLKLKSRTTGNWSTDVDQDVNSGYWASYYVSWTGSAVDRDFRFNGVAYGNAWYRNTGHFIDFQWP